MRDGLENIITFLDSALSPTQTWQEFFIILFQLLVLAVFMHIAYQQIRGTQAEKVLNGLFIVILIVGLFYILNLTILIKTFELILPAAITGIIVLFAPELRRFLHKLGREGFSWKGLLFLIKTSFTSQPTSTNDVSDITEEIIKSISYFSRNKTGALIVFDNTWSDRLYVSSGKKLDASISAELLLNIFYPKSPLHDGAVVIRSKRLYAASVILPITENPLLNPWQYGTRHRAALGATENNNNLCIVVSEETGSISISEGGSISKISQPEDLRIVIQNKLIKED